MISISRFQFLVSVGKSVSSGELMSPTFFVDFWLCFLLQLKIRFPPQVLLRQNQSLCRYTIVVYCLYELPDGMGKGQYVVLNTLPLIFPPYFKKKCHEISLGMWPTVTAFSPDLMWIAQQYEWICFEACFDLFRFNCKSDFSIFHFIFQLWLEMRNYQPFCKNCVKRLILK